jgi:hypothetical protein
MRAKILTFSFLFVFVFLNAQFTIDAKWALVPEISDEFDQTSINTTKWKPILGFEDFMCAPNGECVYDDIGKPFQRTSFPNDNVIIDDGIATILVRNIPTDVTVKCQTEVAPNICQGETWLTQNLTYTVGTLVSQELMQYGYFELKFRIPGPAPDIGATYSPFGPNFWIYAAEHNGIVNSCVSEIDFFEITDGQTQAYTTNTHFTDINDVRCGDGNGYIHDDNNYNSLGTGIFDPLNITGGEWHTAGGHWTPNRIDFYLDGNLIKTNQNEWVVNLDPMRMIIGIAVPLGGVPVNSVNVTYPYSYDLDYVHVYQLVNNGCGIEEEFYCGTEPPNSDGDIVLKSAVFGGSGCGGANFTHMDNSLYANDYILIDENTTLGGGIGTVYLDVNECY